MLLAILLAQKFFHVRFERALDVSRDSADSGEGWGELCAFAHVCTCVCVCVMRAEEGTALLTPFRKGCALPSRGTFARTYRVCVVTCSPTRDAIQPYLSDLSDCLLVCEPLQACPQAICNFSIAIHVSISTTKK